MRVFLLSILTFTVFCVLAFNLSHFVAAEKQAGASEIAFNHREHIYTYGANCETCHSYTAEGEFMGLPAIGQCVTCHERNSLFVPGPAVAGSKKFFDEYSDTDKPWKSHAKHKTKIKFSHKIVLEAQFPDGRRKVTCVSCHGGKDYSTDNAASRGRLTMEQCIKCHKALNIDKSCITCH